MDDRDPWCEVENEDGTFTPFYWPFCAKDGCGNRRAIILNSPYCYPHTIGFEPEAYKRLRTQKKVRKLADIIS